MVGLLCVALHVSVPFVYGHYLWLNATRYNVEELSGSSSGGKTTVYIGWGDFYPVHDFLKPVRHHLERRYPHAHFLGAKHGEALADLYASADVFVFPSRTDTFGIVLIEAMASGLPVAAFPVTGPLDVIGDSGAGALHEDLREACLAALGPLKRAVGPLQCCTATRGCAVTCPLSPIRARAARVVAAVRHGARAPPEPRDLA